MNKEKRRYSCLSVRHKDAVKFQKIRNYPPFKGMTTLGFFGKMLEMAEQSFCPECYANLKFKSCDNCKEM